MIFRLGGGYDFNWSEEKFTFWLFQKRIKLTGWWVIAALVWRLDVEGKEQCWRVL